MEVMSQPVLPIRPASIDDLETVLALLKQRIEWLRSRGSDQWSTWEKWRTKIQPSLERGHVWLLSDGVRPIGTITVEFHGDSDFWTTDECAQPAAYLSKLAVGIDHAGDELGALLIDWASDYAYRRGCRYLRLDAWKTNEKLHAYYVNRGWTFLRTVSNPRRNSGALFQTVVRPLPLAQRRRLRDNFPVAVLEPTQAGPGTTELDPAGNWHPEHVHRGGLRVQYRVLQDPTAAIFIDFMRYRLREADGEWQFESVDGHFTDWHYSGVLLDSNVQLNSGTSYVITHQALDHDSCRLVMSDIPAELAPACQPTMTGVALEQTYPHEPGYD